jgi:type IV pilus assembly protein PilO
MAWSDELKSLEPWKIWVGVGVLLVAVALGYWYFSYSPTMDMIDDLNAKIEKLDKKIRAGQAAKKQHEQFAQQIHQLEAKLDQTIAILPQENALDRLVKQVESNALQSNLEVQLFDPAKKTKKPLYGIQPVNLKLKGLYNDLCGFVEKMAQEDRIINLTDITMVQTGAGPKGLQIAISMTAQIFWFIPRSPTDNAN